MPRISALEHRAVVGDGARRIGTISAVLFLPDGTRIAGVEVRRPAALGVFSRPARYVPFSSLLLADDGAVRVPGGRLPPDSAGMSSIGIAWDATVVWRGMPVRAGDGRRAGVVHDVAYDASSGGVTGLVVSTGIVGDAALGKLEVPAEEVIGFDGECVAVRPTYAEMSSTGGLAKAAATGAAAAGVAGRRLAATAQGLGVAGARALGRSMRSGLGQKIRAALADDEKGE